MPSAVHQSKEQRRLSANLGTPTSQITDTDYETVTNTEGNNTMPSGNGTRRTQQTAAELKQASATVKKLMKEKANLEKDNEALQEDVNKLETEITNLRKENDDVKHKYDELVEEVDKQRDVAKDNPFSKEYAEMVAKKTKRDTWRTVKFISNEQQELKVCELTLDLLNLSNYMLTTNEDKNVVICQKRAAFCALYKGISRESLNEQRNYAQSQAKEKAHNLLAGNETGGMLYSQEDMLAVACRNIPDPEQDKDRYDHLMKVFVWYWDDYLPAIAGNKYWKATIRHSCSMTMANINGTTCIPVGTEAIAILIYENCAAKWVEIYNWKEGDLNSKKKIPKKKDNPKTKDFMGKYSDASSGQAKYGGWSKEGLKRFKELRVLIKNGRNTERAAGLEMDCLARVKVKNNKVGDKAGEGKKNKKRKAKSITEEEEIVIDFDE